MYLSTSFQDFLANLRQLLTGSHVDKDQNEFQEDYIGKLTDCFLANLRQLLTGRTDRCISCVLASMNGTARYLAEYGMRNMSEFAEFKGMIGDLSYHLDRDMGMALMSPLLEVGSNMGEGEVIDAPKPPSPVRGLKRKFSSLDRAIPTAHPSFVPTTLC